MHTDKKIIIIGDGEFAQMAYEYFTYDSDYDVHGFAVEKEFRSQDILFDLPVVDFEEIQTHFPSQAYQAFVAITFTKMNRVRTRLYEETKKKGYQCVNYISSRAFVWRNVKVGDNVFIFEHNTIQPFVTIGNNVILWSGNHIGHHSCIQDHCFISSHVVLSGHCTVAKHSFLGVNSTIGHNTTLGPDTFLAQGAVVTKNLEGGYIYKGSPARPSEMSSLQYFGVSE